MPHSKLKLSDGYGLFTQEMLPGCSAFCVQWQTAVDSAGYGPPTLEMLPGCSAVCVQQQTVVAGDGYLMDSSC